ncbi:hypothetical protein [Streptomyces sp. NPDC088785]
MCTRGLAAQLAIEDGLVARRFLQLGIPLRPLGVHSHTIMTTKVD